MKAAAISYPDPCLSANVYCAGRLSEVIHRVVAPTWREARHSESEEEGYLWLMRYARGGEHLKIRLHGGDRLAEAFREALPGAAEAYFDGLPPRDEEDARLSLPQATPIDEEDKASGERPDRSLLWTHYLRSPISLGAGPYLEEDALVGSHVQALARGTDIVLERLHTGDDGTAPFAQVQGVLLQMVIAGLGASPLDAEGRASYLRYHRDWLLRSALKYGRSGGGPRKMAQTLTTFNRRVQSLGASAEPVAKLARRSWDAPGPDTADPASFEGAIEALFERLVPVLGERRFHVDPFAGQPYFPPLFRILHSVANQLGLNSLNEAFSFHLLLCVATDDDVKHQPVVLSPELGS